MKTSIARQLMGINRRFYNAFASPWSTSRVSIHQGIVRAFEAMHPVGRLLDLGCGDGRVGLWAVENKESNGLVSYTGTDFSAALLGPNLSARSAAPPELSFFCVDMTSPRWSQHLNTDCARFDSAVCFSALHHIPGPRRRLGVLRTLRDLLQPDARCAISVWQLSHVPRLQKKIRAWSDVGIDDCCVEDNDLLVDWKMGGAGLRYVHEFSEQELRHLCYQAGFKTQMSFRSDGQTGDMGLYLILQAR
jgi:SAM-dependent methyltransferase